MQTRIILRTGLCALVLSATLGTAPSALAAGTFISAPQRVDMVHDDSRGQIYITQGGEVLRYDIASGSFLSPIVLGGQLRGIDISPDNGTLAVADNQSSSGDGWIHLVSLGTLAARTVPFVKSSSYETGTYSVSFAADDKVYATTDFAGSGWTPLRRLDPATDTWTPLASVRQRTMLSASGDGQTVAFAEANTSGGSWGLIDIPTGQIVRREGSGGTGWFNYEIATDRLGSQFAVPTYNGAFIYNDAYQNVMMLGQYAGPQPIGAAYHPVEAKAYFPWADSRLVRVFDMNTFTQTEAYDFESDFSSTGNRAYVSGRARLSKDGSLLMVTVSGGVRFLQNYAPLNASSVSASAVAATPVSIALPGTIGNGGSLTYSIVRAPDHGSLTLSGATATYTAQSGYGGSDRFRYRVQYGNAVREAEVDLAVTVPNASPTVVDDLARTRRTSMLIPVLTNDSDPDGDSLTIIAVTQPKLGSAIIEGDRIRFTSPRFWSGSAAFGYTISDGRGGQDSGTVTVIRN